MRAFSITTWVISRMIAGQRDSSGSARSRQSSYAISATSVHCIDETITTRRLMSPAIAGTCMAVSQISGAIRNTVTGVSRSAERARAGEQEAVADQQQRVGDLDRQHVRGSTPRAASRRERRAADQIADAPPAQRVGALVAPPGEQQQSAEDHGDEHRDQRQCRDVKLHGTRNRLRASRRGRPPRAQWCTGKRCRSVNPLRTIPAFVRTVLRAQRKRARRGAPFVSR